MKAELITVLFLIMAGGLSGCGQKGPLYLPTSEQATVEQPGPDSKADRQNTVDR